MKVKRALISVSDKTGLTEFVRGLHRMNVEIISTGGTARHLQQAGIPVQEVSSVTGFPEILDGRVKTLHPSIHGGLLALRDNPDHAAQMREHGMTPIDMVVVNLYPFARTVAKKSVTLEEALENIDIGGPSMLRSAAKNFRSVAVICNPQRYKDILRELDANSGILPDQILRKLAVEAFGHTARYDAGIYDYLSAPAGSSDLAGLPERMTWTLTKARDLRYGENPHQAGAFYQTQDPDGGWGNLKQLHGKELSFNNILDLDAALRVVRDFPEPAAVVIKHNNPTGVATADSLALAYKRAHECDPVSAFGGIIGLNKKADAATAARIAKSGFMECVLAPDFDREALDILTQKKNLRLIQLKLADGKDADYDFKQVAGGFLVQDSDRKGIVRPELTVVTRKKPTAAQQEAMLFGWTVVRHVRSNAVILVKGTQTVGIGCGQTSRVDSIAIAIRKAGKHTAGSVMVSDAFLPKTDNVELAAKAGIKTIIQTGGSIADADVIAAADAAGIAMVMTGVRHFKH